MADLKITPDEIENETWKPIVGYEGYYSVSSLGRIRSERMQTNSKPGHILVTTAQASPPYRKVQLCRDGIIKFQRVHLLVARTFLGPVPRGYETNHKDGDKGNPRLNNLEYVTHKYNMQHAHRTGLVSHPSGSNHPRSSLTPELEGEILNLRGQGLSHRKIARLIGRNPKTVWCALRRIGRSAHAYSSYYKTSRF